MKEIMPVIMNTNFERLAVIDDYISFIWTTRYYTSGDFELCVNVDERNVSLLVKDYYVVRDDDSNVGIIENIQMQRNIDGKEMLIVSGRFLDSILSRRIIGQQTTVAGSISDCINALINQNVISPAIEARKISGFVLGSYTISQTMKAQYTGKNLLDTISKICETYGIGFRVTLNDDHEFVFQLYEGADRTYDQNVNPWVIFSDKYDNLLSSEYEEDYQAMTNAVLVAGEGEGTDRKTLWVSSDQDVLTNDPADWEQGGMAQGQNRSYTTRIRTITGVAVKPDTHYVISKTAGTAIAVHQMTEKDGTFIEASDWMTDTSSSFKTAENCGFVRVMVRYDPASTIQPDVIGDSVIITMQESASGMARRETYKDQRNLQSDDGEITESEYTALLKESGTESLTKYTAAFTGTVYFDGITYKEDVNIGDLCVIENSRWGIYLNSRLVEVIESVSENGEYSIVPTFGI